MVLRRWSHQAHLLGAAIEKIVVIALDDGLLSEDDARQYMISCTSFVIIYNILFCDDHRRTGKFFLGGLGHMCPKKLLR